VRALLRAGADPDARGRDQTTPLMRAMASEAKSSEAVVEALLAAEGIGAAVVSLPCWELFDQQSEAYRQEVLGTGVRVAVEAACGFGWERYLGPIGPKGGGFVGMTGFGASAPGKVCFQEFGITAENVAATAKDLLKKLKEEA